MRDVNEISFIRVTACWGLSLNQSGCIITAAQLAVAAKKKKWENRKDWQKQQPMQAGAAKWKKNRLEWLSVCELWNKLTHTLSEHSHAKEKQRTP